MNGLPTTYSGSQATARSDADVLTDLFVNSETVYSTYYCIFCLLLSVFLA